MTLIRIGLQICLIFFANIVYSYQQMNKDRRCPELKNLYLCDDDYQFKIKSVVDQGVLIFKINDISMQTDSELITSEKIVAGHKYQVQQRANCSHGILFWEELFICQEDVQNICAKGEVAQIKQQRYSLPDQVTLKMNEAWSVGYGPMYKQRFCRPQDETIKSGHSL